MPIHSMAYPCVERAGLLSVVPARRRGLLAPLLLLLILLLRSRLRALSEGHSRWRVAWLSGLGWSSSLAVLLHLKLTLLHFLKHLLRSFYAGLIGSRLLLLGFGSLIGSFFDGFVCWICFSGVGCGRRCGTFGGLSVGCRSIWRFGNKHDANQQACIFRRAQQNVVEMRSVKKLGDYVARGAGTETGGDALGGIGWNVNIGGGMFAHAAQNVTQCGVRGDDGELAILIVDLRGHRGHGVERNLRDRALRA